MKFWAKLTEKVSNNNETLSDIQRKPNISEANTPDELF